jgi:hypothetical protein
LIEGTTTYLGAELKDGKIYYRISLRSGGAEWAEQQLFLAQITKYNIRSLE